MAQQVITAYQEKINVLVRLRQSDSFQAAIAVLEARKNEIDALWHTYRGENLMAALGGKSELEKILKDIRTAVEAFEQPQEEEPKEPSNASVY